MDSFEEYLKKEAQSFKVEPSSRVWEGVRSAIAKPSRIFVWWYGAAALLIVLGSAIGYYNYSDSKVKNAENRNELKKEKSGNQVSASPGKAASKPGEENNNIVKDTKQKISITAKKDKHSPLSAKSIQSKNEIYFNPNIEKPITIDEPRNRGISSESNKGHSNNNIITLLPQKPFLFEHPTIGLHDKAIDLTNIPLRINISRSKQNKFTYAISAGINLSKPVKINYNNYVKPSFSYNLMLSTTYHFNYLLGISAGIGYQQDSYKIGAIMANPDTIYLPSSNGPVPQPAPYRLSNESQNVNITRQILIPLALEYKILLTMRGDISAFTGVDFAKSLAPHYLIKSPTNDRLFSNNGILNPIYSYLSLGVAYHQKINNKIGWMCSYKVQYQAGNKYKKDYGLKERLLINGINFGIVF